jgi:hypothetical protein
MLISLDSLMDAVDQKHGPFGWIFQQDGAPSRTSQVAMYWLAETVDAITDLPANPPALSPIQLSWEIFKTLVRRMKRQTLQELKSVLLGAWSLIPHDIVNRLCKGFQTRLQLCPVNQG